jgi:hypothetical protein
MKERDQMSKERPEATFGSNVSVWKNKTGRSVTISPRQYQDKDGQWKTASGWNVSDIAHLAHCLKKALDHCLDRRAEEERLTRPQEDSGPQSDGGSF